VIATAHKSGFTLIETALALLAISLGLLGIFGLARLGLKSGGEVEHETRCAMLADTMFETLKAKNSELAARKYTLAEWRNYWVNAKTFYLPPMPEISDNTTGIRIDLGTHEMDDFLPTSGRTPSIKWNPVYTLVFSANAAAEWNEITVGLTLHPGALQSGAAAQTYATVLSYAGGQP